MPPPLPSSFSTAIAALVLGAVAMGVSPVFVRIADVGPFTSAFWRLALALPLLWGWVRFEGRETAVPWRPSLPVVLAGLSFAGDLFFWHLAIFRTSVANATFFATTAPLWVVIVGWALFHTPATRATLIGLGLCLAGGAALVGRSLAIETAHVTGDVFGMATGLFFGLYFLAVQAARASGLGAARVTFDLSLIAALVLLAVALCFETRFWPQSPGGWAALLAMAWISHAGGQGLLSIALGRLPVVFSSLVIFLEAIAAAIFGWLILSEPVSAVQGAGGLLILLGIWAARPRPPRPGGLA